MLPFTFNPLFTRKAPLVKLMDLRVDTADLTTYTFSACNIGDLGTEVSEDETSSIEISLPRTPGRKFLAVCIHGEDAAATFSINGCTLGGVAGVERVDRGGATAVVNSGIYTWNTDIIQNLANTDIVVTWSEAITSCAIGVLSVENMGPFDRINSANNQGTSTMSLSPSASAKADIYTLMIGCGSCSGANTNFEVEARNAAGITTQVNGNHPDLLYSGTSAELSYAAFWMFSNQYVTPDMPPCRIECDWSGADGADVVGVTFA
jgi:hypothetical protein